ncbi:hypothetical protein lbkm_1010 [Lachnospiraceae bacterium KM106-2]|nr:hypothetical protein lbkm_1010 [Lachnospiraceae bacterium KM106-2]
MPWCPNCKMEYRKGIETCAECGATLVDQLEDSEQEMTTEETTNSYEDQQEQYQKLINSSSTTYVKKEDQYRDLHSTFQVFLFFGILMIIFDILNIAGIFHLFSNWLQHSVILATSVAFIYVAFHSRKQAGEVKSEIGLENSTTNDVQDYLAKHMPKERLEAFYQDDVSKEENYLHIVDAIKAELKESFPTANDSLLDELIEDYYDKIMEL